MATAKKVATKTAVVEWDKALAERAVRSKKTEEAVSVGSFISFKGGVLAYAGNPVAGNKLAVVVLDAILENKFYTGKYDPNNKQPPACYAFGRDEDDMAPHEKASDPQSETCATCPHNEWDSGEGGRGKACKNVRRLAIIPADALKNGEDGVADAEVAYAELSVTSVKGWAGYVNQLAATNRPPLAYVTEIMVTPDAKTQFKINFKALEPVPNELLGAVLDKADKVEAMIEFPYQAASELPAKPVRSGTAGRAVANAKKPVLTKTPAPARTASKKPAVKTRKF